MAEIVVFHGSPVVIEKPICNFGRDNLDFGKGFYLTDIRKQAENWAKRSIATNPEKKAVLNIYTLEKEALLEECRSKIFDSYDEDWLGFIIDSRTGLKPWLNFDYIEGGVANDRVIDTVNLYIAGLMDLRTALGRLAMHQPNNQICLLNQAITDKYLKFDGYEYV